MCFINVLFVVLIFYRNFLYTICRLYSIFFCREQVCLHLILIHFTKFLRNSLCTADLHFYLTINYLQVCFPITCSMATCINLLFLVVLQPWKYVHFLLEFKEGFRNMNIKAQFFLKGQICLNCFNHWFYFTHYKTPNTQYEISNLKNLKILVVIDLLPIKSISISVHGKIIQKSETVLPIC